LIFDSTLGYPGEGPAKIATYNINGAKEKLYQVLAAASRAKIDILLLQETHYYQSTRFHVSGVQSTAKRAGWTALHAPATAADPKAGVACLVRADSQAVSLVSGTAPLRGLNGRLIGAECQIENERTYICSLYLPAKPDKRLEVLLKIEQQGLIKHNSIVGAISTALIR
jgi:exonuclease III